MDWKAFEELATDVLQFDDMPGVRRLGGGTDSGIDAREESYFESRIRGHTVIQVSSQAAQERKVKETIAKLKSNQIAFDRLVMLFRDPVSSSLQAKLRASASNQGVVLEIRDELYLVGQLTRNETGTFKKHFGTQEEFLDHLLGTSPRIGGTGKKVPSYSLEQGILASACTYGLAKADVIRIPAFDRIVLAVMVGSTGGRLPRGELLREVNTHVATLDEAMLSAALSRLSRKGLCKYQGNEVVVPAAQRAGFSKNLSSLGRTLERATNDIVAMASEAATFDDAATGRAIRNLQHVIADLVRACGPLPSDEAQKGIKAKLPEIENEVKAGLAEGLTRKQSGAIGVALEQYLSDKENAAFLSALLRTYAVLASCQLDPLGKHYSRSCYRDRDVYLDTDVILNLVLKELPECEGVRNGLKALHASGARLIVTDEVLREVVHHFSISETTYHAVPGLKNLPEAVAAVKIRNALTRAFYYAQSFGGNLGDFRSFRRNYLEHSDPLSYVKELVASTEVQIHCIGAGVDLLTKEERQAQDRLSEMLSLGKEKTRRKAQYRTTFMMDERADIDAMLALLASRVRGNSTGQQRAGRIVSDDSGYVDLLRSPDWEGREAIRIRRSQLPVLSDLLVDSASDASLVRMLWSPVAAFAAESLGGEVEELARQGASLSRCSRTRLMRDLQDGLASVLGAYRRRVGSASSVSQRVEATYQLHKQLASHGHPPDGSLAILVRELAESSEIRDAGTQAVKRMKSLLKLLINKSQSTAKSRGRMRRAIRDAGLSDLLEGADAGD